MRYGSACSGIEAPTVAWRPLGWEAAWYTEIERFPCAVLGCHYPSVPNLGDITALTEAQLDERGPIDVLVGGTPCQSFSVAGLRKGLADPRGNLALRFCQLAGILGPTWVLWENVPGVLSADKGRAFGSILGALAELGYGLCYRILDAQYFGVPQRRRRVFVVGHLGDWRRAASVLFERESLYGYPPPRRKKGTGVAALTARGVGTCGADDNQRQAGHLVAQGITASYRKGADSDCTDTLITHPLMGKGLDASEDGTGRGTPIIPIDMRQASRGEKVTNNRPEGSSGGPPGTGIGQEGDPAPSIAQSHPPAIAYRTSGNSGVMEQGDRTAALNCGTDKTQSIVAYQCQGTNVGEMGHLRAGNQGTTGGVPFINDTMAVRRLTPRECERLQGFPDDYTKIPYRSKTAEQCPDGPRYRALGNSMAVPVMRWIGRRIAETGANPMPPKGGE